MSVFVDTSAIFAFLDRDDAGNAAAIEAMRTLLGTEQLITHNYVIVEAAALVQRRLQPGALRALLDDLLPAIRIVWVDEATHGAATSALLGAVRRRISFVDWVSFEVMRREGIRRAFTFDRDFTTQGFDTTP